MKRHSLFALILLTGFSMSLHAQNESDALKYAMQNYTGSARSAGAGTAFGAIGADPICAAVNPAGLARFRTSAFYVSTSFTNVKNNARYIGNSQTDNKFNFNIPNIALIINIPGTDYENKNPSEIVNFTVGFNLNRLNNFHYNTLYSGNNQASSITQAWAEKADANNSLPELFSAYSVELLAYNTFLIDYDTTASTPKYQSAYGKNPLLNTRQFGSILSKGAINDYNMSFAANYMHKVYFGLTLGLKSVRSIEAFEFNETDLRTVNVKDIQRLRFNQYISTRGTGFNAKLGINAAPNEYLRLGLAYHTPTTYNLTDSYSYRITSYFDYDARDPFNNLRESSVFKTEAAYKYRITSPSRTIFSAGLVDKNVGFFSIDLEVVNYGAASLQPTRANSADESFTIENTNIQRLYKDNAVNFRAGLELVDKIFRYRAGYGYYASPYNPEFFPDASQYNRQVYSLGFGIKTNTYAFDFAYVNTRSASLYIPYTLSNTTHYGITNNFKTTSFIVSASFPID